MFVTNIQFLEINIAPISDLKLLQTNRKHFFNSESLRKSHWNLSQIKNNFSWRGSSRWWINCGGNLLPQIHQKYIFMWNNFHRKRIGKKGPHVIRKDRKDKALGCDMDPWDWEAICKEEKVHMGGLSCWECAGQGKSWTFQSWGYEQRRESSLPAEKSPETEDWRSQDSTASMLAC